MMDIPKDKLTACIASAKKMIKNGGNCLGIPCLKCHIEYNGENCCLEKALESCKQFLSDIEGGKCENI
jgi:hypothetical protein